MTATVPVDIPNDEYHALPSLSSSGARKLLPPSCPAIFRWEQDHPVHRDYFDFGSAAHKVVLGDMSANVAVIDADNWYTRRAKDARDEARAVGRIPILTADWQTVLDMAAAIQQHPIASRLLDPLHGRSEQSLSWTDPATGVDCRARLDWLPDPGPGRMIVPDYKTAKSASPQAFRSSAANYGYHMQAAWYLQALQAGLDEDPAFVFIVQEKTPPYLVSVIELGPDSLELGATQNHRAREIFRDCTAANTWPGYTDGVDLIELPGWYFKQQEMT